MNVPTAQIPDVIRALEHYAAYMLATNRDDRPYRDLAALLKRRATATRPEKVGGSTKFARRKP